MNEQATSNKQQATKQLTNNLTVFTKALSVTAIITAFSSFTLLPSFAQAHGHSVDLGPVEVVGQPINLPNPNNTPPNWNVEDPCGSGPGGGFGGCDYTANEDDGEDWEEEEDEHACLDITFSYEPMTAAFANDRNDFNDHMDTIIAGGAGAISAVITGALTAEMGPISPGLAYAVGSNVNEMALHRLEGYQFQCGDILTVKFTYCGYNLAEYFSEEVNLLTTTITLGPSPG